MAKYACSSEGAAELKKAAGSIKQGADEIRTQTTTIRTLVSGYDEVLGPHKTALEESIEQIANAVTQYVEPADNVCKKLNEIAQKYEEIASKKRFQKGGASRGNSVGAMSGDSSSEKNTAGGVADSVSSKGGSGTRPTWRQSEIDAKADFPDYNEQISFKDGIEDRYGTKGSVRPDYYKAGSSVDIKNYNVETANGRSNLANNISKQYYQRSTHLPQGTKQSVMIDVRGQNVSNVELEILYNSIMEKTNNGITVYFKTN